VERSVLASELPAAARLVALALLTYCDNGRAVVSRKHGPSLTVLARCTGLGITTIKRELNRLESGGWVKRERPEPAAARARLARTAYTLCPVVSGATLDPGRPTTDLPVGPPRTQTRPTTDPEVGPGWTTAQNGQNSQQQQPRGVQVVITKTGCTEAEAQAVLDLIETEKKPRSLVGLVNRIAQDGELGVWLDRVRATKAAADMEQRGRTEHAFEAGRSPGYCRVCGRHETNRIHQASAA
jgi:hypothetical protein